MRIVLDTNVFISGVFFTGPPHQILKAWRDGQVQILISPEILEEYSRVGSNLASRFKGVDLEPFLELMTIHSEMITPPAHVQRFIISLRNENVMLDRDLANLYGVETKQLKRAVRRNIRRFRPDFMLELTKEEYHALRYQFGTLKRGEHSK